MARTIQPTGESPPLLQRAELSEEATSGWPTGAPVTTLVLDEDDFRDLSDRLGDEAGSQVLLELTDRLQERLLPAGVTTHLDLDRLGIRCEGLVADQHLTEEVVDALAGPLRVGEQMVELRTRRRSRANRVSRAPRR